MHSNPPLLYSIIYINIVIVLVNTINLIVWIIDNSALYLIDISHNYKHYSPFLLIDK